jgi:hypothetical protein
LYECFFMPRLEAIGGASIWNNQIPYWCMLKWLYCLDTSCFMQLMLMGNKMKFMGLWLQKDYVNENNVLQQHINDWLKYIDDHDYSWVTRNACI